MVLQTILKMFDTKMNVAYLDALVVNPLGLGLDLPVDDEDDEEDDQDEKDARDEGDEPGLGAWNKYRAFR